MLDKIKVAEFAWVGVGAMVGTMLAAQGATVVRVESITRPDPLRTMAPFKDNIPGVNRSAFYAIANPNKYSLALNLNKPKAIEVAKKLIIWADVMTESFTPGSMQKWGLDYESVRQFKPDIVYLSTSMQGQGGPHSKFRGFGFHMAALSGFYHLTGYEDSEPVGPYGAYSDFIAGIYNQIIALAAILYHHKTGKGLYVDLSQLEAAVHFLTPVLLDYTVNKHEWIRMGNKDIAQCPHGVYPCKGEESWIAISVKCTEEWEEFCKVLRSEEWLNDRRFSTLTERKKNETELDKLIASKTREFDAYELMHSLQRSGVAAGVVQKPSQVIADPQYQALGQFVTLEHAEIGPMLYNAGPFRLSEHDRKYVRVAPCLGEHTELVLKEFLGMADEEIAELVSEGVLE